MDKRAWYIHLEQETFGPLLLQTLTRLIQNHRVNLMEYVWRPGLKNWVRLAELSEFHSLLPAPPAVPVPENAPIPAQALMAQAAPAAFPPASSAAAQASEQTPSAPLPSTWSPAPLPQSSTQERTSKIRKFERAPLRGQIVLINSQHPPIEIVNVSEGGMLLKSPGLPPIGAELHFRIESGALPAKPEMTGIVRRHINVKEFCGFGIEFINIPPDQKQMLKSYIRTQIFIT